MTPVDRTRATIDAPAIPVPRTGEENTVPAPAPPVASYPWPEPWHFSRAARPRSEFWDATTASWHSGGPNATPRQD